MARSGMNTSGTTFDPDVPKNETNQRKLQAGFADFPLRAALPDNFIIGMVLLAFSQRHHYGIPVGDWQADRRGQWPARCPARRQRA